ncbi:MAG: crossover junction endodeoxyribonuclease RuvC [Thermovirga sp.]|nr:crossover junction endodeoxyribonuclease RuvC [Thermovirga sp.]
MRRVCLGIDPGLGKLGYGVVIEEKSVMRAGEFGCIKTEPGTPVEARILQIHEKLRPLIERTGPELLSVERLFFGRNTTTAENVFQVRGVVLLLAARHGIPLVQPKPSEVKLAVCGNGRAEKSQVQKMVFRLLRLESIPCQDDAADALAIALTGLALSDFQMKTESGD